MCVQITLLSTVVKSLTNFSLIVGPNTANFAVQISVLLLGLIQFQPNTIQFLSVHVRNCIDTPRPTSNALDNRHKTLAKTTFSDRRHTAVNTID